MESIENSRCKKYKKCLRKSEILSRHLSGTEEKSILEQTGSYVLAPALNSFVIWLLQDALARGIQRLYFLARDGYFMYRTAEIFCRKFQLPVECRYLYCSRYSLRVPMYHLDMDDAMEYICRGGIDVTMQKLLKRSGISKEEQEETLKILNLSFPATQSIPYAKLPEIRKKLEECRFFTNCVYRHSHEELPNLRGYLSQEGLFDEVPKAIVDSGWTGSTQKDLQRLLSYFGKEECGKTDFAKPENKETGLLEGYYWGLYELPPDVKKEQYHCYYFQPRRTLREKVHFSNCLFETIYSAPHGMTVGYAFSDKKYVPIFAPYDKGRKHFMESLEQLFAAYAARLADSMESIGDVDCAKDRKVIRKLLKMFMGKPAPEEAELFGRLEFSDDVLEDDKQQVAVYLNEAELKANHAANKALVMLGLKQEYIKESAWYEGSAVRYGKHVRWHLVWYRAYKYLLYLRQMYWKR